MRRKTDLAHPDDEKDAAIDRGIVQDPDTVEGTAEALRAARPARDVVPEIVADYMRRRARQRTPTKELISLRLDPDALAGWRATGAGWQSRINMVLRQALSG